MTKNAHDDVPKDIEPNTHRVVIAGAGTFGTAAAIELIREFSHPGHAIPANRTVEIVLVDPKAIVNGSDSFSTELGMGKLANTASVPTTNLPAIEMSGRPNTEEGLARLQALASKEMGITLDARDSVPRHLVGRMLEIDLAEALAAKPSNIVFKSIQGSTRRYEAGEVAIRAVGDQYYNLATDTFVVAAGLGGLQRSIKDDLRYKPVNMISEPYKPENLARIDKIPKDAVVHVVGNGLTGMDVENRLLENGHTGKIIGTSKRMQRHFTESTPLRDPGILPEPRFMAQLRTELAAHQEDYKNYLDGKIVESRLNAAKWRATSEAMISDGDIKDSIDRAIKECKRERGVTEANLDNTFWYYFRYLEDKPGYDSYKRYFGYQLREQIASAEDREGARFQKEKDDLIANPEKFSFDWIDGHRRPQRQYMAGWYNLDKSKERLARVAATGLQEFEERTGWSWNGRRFDAPGMKPVPQKSFGERFLFATGLKKAEPPRDTSNDLTTGQVLEQWEKHVPEIMKILGPEEFANFYERNLSIAAAMRVRSDPVVAARLDAAERNGQLILKTNYAAESIFEKMKPQWTINAAGFEGHKTAAIMVPHLVHSGAKEHTQGGLVVDKNGRVQINPEEEDRITTPSGGNVYAMGAAVEGATRAGDFNGPHIGPVALNYPTGRAQAVRVAAAIRGDVLERFKAELPSPSPELA